MIPIIDMHAHLGNVLYPNGGALIEAVGVRKRLRFDLISLFERLWHRRITGLAYLTQWGYWADTTASRARNATATRENFRRSMDETGVTLSVALPIPPHVTFLEVRAAAGKDPGIIPFTGVDFTRGGDIGAALAADVAAGAKGLKLHPILQRVALDDRRTFEVVEAFAPHGLPILFHCGTTHYYLDASEQDRHIPAFGLPHHARNLIEAFPRVHFIVGHAGVSSVHNVMAMFGGHSNVWVEPSFQSPATVRELMAVFGPERVVFGSDWPWGNRAPAIAIIRRACRGDKGLERRLFYENAAELLRLAEVVEPGNSVVVHFLPTRRRWLR